MVGVFLLDRFKGGENLEDKGDKTAISEDHTKTWGAILDLAATAAAQNAFQTMHINGVFENKDFLATDEFLDSTGTNNTVNTGSSTANYDQSFDPEIFYFLSFTDEASGDTTNDPDSYTDPGNAFDSNDSTFATKAATANASLGKTFASKFVGGVRIKADYTGAGTSPANTMIIQTFNGSVWADFKTILSSTSAADSFDDFVFVDTTTQGIRLKTVNGTGGGFTSNVFSVEYGDYDTSATVVCDSAIKTLVGTEESICVYADVDLPTNTTMTVDVSDGTTTISAQPLNTAIGLTGFIAGTLEITFNLGSSDDTATPLLRGYGVVIK